MKHTIYIKTKTGTIDVQDIQHVKCVRNAGSFPGEFIIGTIYKVKKIYSKPYDNSRGCTYHTIEVIGESGGIKMITGGFHYSEETLVKSGIGNHRHTGFVPYYTVPYDLY